MDKLRNLFEKKKENILSVYFTAGFPSLNDTGRIITALEENNVDMIEIGIPFSDPLADGPVIQKSSETALKNGMNIRLLFRQLKEIQNRIVDVPLLLMGYLNPILQFGVEEFCREASAHGISALIIPDLPLQEYLDEYKTIFEKHGLRNIFLITPQTSETRLRLIDQHSDAFIYMVSSASITGSRAEIGTSQAYFKRIAAMNLKSPRLIGFGIHDHDGFATACQYANGAIIGSAFIRAVEESADLESDIRNFTRNILNPELAQLNS